MITELIQKQVKSQPELYSGFYNTHDEEINTFVANIDGVKSDIYITNIHNQLNYLRFACVFSDLVNMYPKVDQSKGAEMRLIIPHNIKRTVTVNIPEEIYNKILVQNGQPQMHMGYVVPTPEEFTKILQEVQPLILANRVVVHNRKILMALDTYSEKDTDSTQWTLFDISRNSPTDNFMIMQNSEQTQSIPVDFSNTAKPYQSDLFDISVPYIRDIKLSELVKALDDNQDILASFRTSLKELIDHAKKNEKSITEMKNDIVRPQIDAINKEFKKIQRIHKIKTAGATMATIGLTLVACTQTGMSQLISSFLGAVGGSRFLSNEVDYTNEVKQLSDKPLYLMWDLKKRSKNK